MKRTKNLTPKTILGSKYKEIEKNLKMRRLKNFYESETDIGDKKQ